MIPICETMKVGYSPTEDIYVVCTNYVDGMIEGYRSVRKPDGTVWKGLGTGMTPARLAELQAMVLIQSEGDVYGELLFDTHTIKKEEIKHLNIVPHGHKIHQKKVQIRIDEDIKIQLSFDSHRTVKIEVDDTEVYA